MTGDRVVPIRPGAPPPAPADRRAGYLDLHWAPVFVADRRRWETHGELPDRPGVMRTRLAAQHLPAGADPEAFARVMAQLLNDLDPGAAALMEDALLHEGHTDD